MALPRFGVVVLNWNGRALLGDLLPGLLASDHPDFFVIVVDNGSRDGSAEWLRHEHPSLEVLALPENRRFAGGNNAGAERALQRGADVVFLLNNDTCVEPSCLRRLAEDFAEDRELGVLGPRICYFDRPERIWYGGGRLRRGLGLVYHRAIRRGVGEGADPPGETDWVSGCALAVRADLWRELGGLDEGYYIYAEDVDLCLRAAERGVRICYQPEALLYHKVSASVGGRMSAFKSYHKTRAGLRLFARHTRGLARLSSYCGLAAHDLAMAAWLLFSGQVRAALAVARAWSDAARARTSFQMTEGSSKG